ncbi:MAG: Hint domain-containing protein [Rhodobacteraceae bacterium]|nr:Hint domain-containing protein [Paracoccaceae bacterium]
MTLTIRQEGQARLAGRSLPAGGQEARARGQGVPGLPAGTRIDTIEGPLAAGMLRPGHLVMTRDAGYRPVRWAGTLAGAQAPGAGIRMAVIAAGAFGPGCPQRDLALPAGHRLLVAGPAVEAAAGESEALAAAGDLEGVTGAVRAGDAAAAEAGAPVLILLDTHEVIRAEGLWCESGRPEAGALALLEEDGRTSLLAAFPELGLPGGDAAFRPARPVLDPGAVRAVFGRGPATAAGTARRRAAAAAG